MKSSIRWGLLALQFLLALSLTEPALAESTADSKIVSPNCSSPDHGYWNAESARRPWRVFAPDADRDC